MRVCDREALVRFLKKQLEEDDRLDFLFHLDSCPSCWEEVYSAEKATHPEYYKKPSSRSRVLEKELQRLERAGEEQDEIVEVA
jgi:hypothetical protein